MIVQSYSVTRNTIYWYMTSYHELKLVGISSKSCVYPLYLLLFFFTIYLFQFQDFFVVTTAAYALRERDTASFIFYWRILGVILTNWQMQKSNTKVPFRRNIFLLLLLPKGGGGGRAGKITVSLFFTPPFNAASCQRKSSWHFSFSFHFILYLENRAFIFNAISLASCLFMPALFTDLICFYEILSLSYDWRFSCCLLKDVFPELV